MAGAFGLEMPSPQLSSTSYGREAPYVDRGAYIEQQAQFLPQIYAQEAREQAYNEQMAMQRQSMRDARRDANTGLAIKGVELGYNLSQNPLAQRYGKSVMAALRPKPWQAPATDLAPANYMQNTPAGGNPLNAPLVPDVVPETMTLPNVDAFAVNPQTPGMANFSTSTGASGTAPVVSAPSPAPSPSLLSQIGGFQGVLPKFGGTGVASQAGNFAMGALPGLAGSAAGALVERSNFGESLHKRVGGGEKEWDTFGGAASGFMTGFLLGGVPGGIAGGIGGLLKGLF